jgi:thiol-disulfide isomerase/thioredoxin
MLHPAKIMQEIFLPFFAYLPYTIIMKTNFAVATLLAVLGAGQISAVAQKGLQTGNPVQDLAAKKILNYSINQSSFTGLKGKLTIIDFFGTWCAPCIKALPVLKNIKDQFANDVNVILVSSETEAQLKKFLNIRKGVSFPLIVDEDNLWNNAFQPPALPYTVIVNNNGIVTAITEAQAITANRIEDWLKDTVVAARATKPKTVNAPMTTPLNQKSSNALVQLSQEYIYAAKTNDNTDRIVGELKKISYEYLTSTLKTDNEKKTFWINIYNGYTQFFLRKNPDRYKDRKSFFKTKQIEIAGRRFSFDDIEHGFLRHSKIKWSLGYFGKLFPGKTEKDLRVGKLDYRIHFALNCGAKSCPPIAFYSDKTLDTQLDLATKAYLSGESEIDPENKVIHLPTLMGWFRRDFGGKKGMIGILRRHDIIPKTARPKIKFKTYDWNLYLDNFRNEK